MKRQLLILLGANLQQRVLAYVTPAEVSQEEVAAERQYAAPDGLDDVAGLTPEQIIRIYSARPPMLFTALHKEPTASGITSLTAENPGASKLEAM